MPVYERIGTVVFYRLRKWYVDTVSAQGDYLFSYLSELVLFGIRRCQLTFILTSSGGSPRIFNFPLRGPLRYSGAAAAEFHMGELHFRITREGLEVRAEEGGCRLSCRSSANFEVPLPELRLIIRGAGRSSISWFPLGIRIPVRAAVRLPGRTLQLQSSPGYADFLESALFPLIVPLRRLFWGRLHAGEMNLVYTVYQARSGEQRGKVLVQVNHRLFVFNRVCLQSRDWSVSPDLKMRYPKRVVLFAWGKGNSLELDVRHTRITMESDFVSDSGASRIERIGVRFLSRNLRSIKFFATADIKFMAAGHRVVLKRRFLIAEFVRLS